MSNSVHTGPLCSLVLLSFRRFNDTTGPCLNTLADLGQLPELELLVVDNGSDDGAAQACASAADAQPHIRFLPLPKNLGFGGGMNAGVSASKGAWVGLVNSDTLFPPGTLQRLVALLPTVPAKVGLVCPVTNAAGNGQCLPVPGMATEELLQIARRAAAQPTGALIDSYRADFFCVFIRRQLWEELKGLDEIFGLGYYEDFDFSLRARAVGADIVIAEDLYILHVGSASFKAMGAAQRALMARNKALMQARHPGARYEHQRQGNAQALAALLDKADSQGWNEALRARAAWRYAELLRNEPRSPFKRWRWRWSLRALKQRLAAANLHPSYPRALG